jgi:hypothetical protein
MRSDLSSTKKGDKRMIRDLFAAGVGIVTPAKPGVNKPYLRMASKATTVLRSGGLSSI